MSNSKSFATEKDDRSARIFCRIGNVESYTYNMHIQLEHVTILYIHIKMNSNIGVAQRSRGGSARDRRYAATRVKNWAPAKRTRTSPACKRPGEPLRFIERTTRLRSGLAPRQSRNYLSEPTRTSASPLEKVAASPSWPLTKKFARASDGFAAFPLAVLPLRGNYARSAISRKFLRRTCTRVSRV